MQGRGQQTTSFQREVVPTKDPGDLSLLIRLRDMKEKARLVQKIDFQADFFLGESDQCFKVVSSPVLAVIWLSKD